LRTLRRCVLLFALAGLSLQPGLLFPPSASAAVPQTAAKNRKKAKRRVKQPKKQKVLKGKRGKHHPKPA
jgi:predicted small lipoprotein YifL